MELIIKPTGRCNFNCTFCSANMLNIKHCNSVPNQLKEILQNLNPHSLIITGGDPLMVEPKYYNELLSLGEWNISLTTNLKDFYFNPKKWVDIFCNPRVGICTSFQYGNQRLWDKNTPYTEEKFKEVCALFNHYVGYNPSFIAVINKENEDRAIDHVYLAKQLNTKVKLNPVMQIGLSTESYPKYKMVDIWLKIKELNLLEYVDMDIQFIKGGCGFNTNGLCSSTIRAVYLDNNGLIHYSNCEECLSSKDYQIPIDAMQPNPAREKINYKTVINNKCLECELCNLCNGCKIAQDIAKQDSNYCQEMLKRKERILESGWKLG